MDCSPPGFSVHEIFQVRILEQVEFPVAQAVKNPPAMKEIRVRSLGQEDPLEKQMATHSSILAWRIPLKKIISKMFFNVNISCLMEDFYIL